MKIIDQITETELLRKVEAAVSKKTIWQKPLLLLTKDGSDYNYIIDALNKKCHVMNINNNPSFSKFVRVNGKLELSLNGQICNAHHPEVDVYEYLGGPLAYDENIHRYCIDLVEYDAKPVISFICVADKNCAAENIPAWIQEQFEIAMLKLYY